MKRLFVAALVCTASAIILGKLWRRRWRRGGPTRVVAKLYLFGTMSSNSIISTVFSNISTAGFKDYSGAQRYHIRHFSAPQRYPCSIGAHKGVDGRCHV